MDVKVESQSVDVIASGTVIAFIHEPITISIGPPTDRLNIIIVFEIATTPFPIPGSTKPEVRSEILNPSTLRMTFKNVYAQAGYGTVNPFSIGTIEGKQVYMQYRIYDLGGTSDKMLHYTFYRSR